MNMLVLMNKFLYFENGLPFGIKVKTADDVGSCIYWCYYNIFWFLHVQVLIWQLLGAKILDLDMLQLRD